MSNAYTLSDYLSAYEGEAPISIIHNIDGDVCHGVDCSIIRSQSWYKKYENEYVISFKIIRDEKANGSIVLLLLM